MDPFRDELRGDYAAESVRRRRFLDALNWGWLGMGALALVSIPFYPDQSLLLGVIVSVTLSTFLAVRFLSGRDHLREACVLFVLFVDFGLFAIFLVQSHQIGIASALETHAPSLMMMGLAVLFAGALLNPRAPFLVALLNSLLLGALVWLNFGREPRFSLHVFRWLLALVAWLYERTLEDAFGRLSAAGRDLQSLVDRRTGELRETVTRLSDAMTALEATNRELDATNRELDAFTSAVSHDLRAPVRSVIGFADALYEEHSSELSPPGIEHLNRVRKAGRRMNSLIDDLLHLSRVSRSEMYREEMDLSAVGRRIVDDLQRVEPGRKLDYRTPERLKVMGYPRLLQVLLEPESVIVRDVRQQAALCILEQNYESDPLSQGLLLKKFEGREIDFEITPRGGGRELVRGRILRSGYVPHPGAIQRYGRQSAQTQTLLSNPPGEVTRTGRASSSARMSSTTRRRTRRFASISATRSTSWVSGGEPTSSAAIGVSSNPSRSRCGTTRNSRWRSG